MVQIEPPLFVFIDDLSAQRVLTNKAGRSPVGNPAVNNLSLKPTHPYADTSYRDKNSKS